MILTAVLLLQVASTRPTLTPTPVPKRAPAANPLAGTATADTKPRAIGETGPQSSSIGSLGARVKLNRDKARSIFNQDVVPTPAPAAAANPAAAAEAKKRTDEQVAKMMADDIAAEKTWRAREQDRRSRLADARENQRDVCARYAAAMNSAGTQDGVVSDAAGAILGALRADCNTATRKADAVEAEIETLKEACRKTPGCHPGWLR